MDDWVKITNILSSIATFIAMVLAVYAIYIKRNELFRGSIYNRQIDSLLEIRQRLHNIWYHIYYAHSWAHNIVLLNRSLVEFEKEQPEDWLKYRKFQDDCYFVFYAFSHDKNGTFPSWFKPIEHKDILGGFEKIAPFTLNALSQKSRDEIIDFQNLLLRKISAIDEAIECQV